jgi:hypothetical protein
MGVTRRYHYKVWLLVARSIMLPLYFLTLALPVIGVVWVLRQGALEFPAALILLPPACMVGAHTALWSLLIVFTIGNVFSTYLATSPDGLEYRHWPRHVRGGWAELERMGESRWGKPYPFVRFRKSETLEDNRLAMFMRRLLGLLPMPDYFTFHSFRGYPAGPLADDLRLYAPHLFDPDSAAHRTVDFPTAR